MSLQRIRKAFLEVQDTQFSFIDDEIIELLSALTEHIIALGTEHSESEIKIENCITIAEFEKRYKFIAGNTLYRYCNHDENFSKRCAIRDKGRWLIDAEATITFLKSLPTFKKRLERLGTN